MKDLQMYFERAKQELDAIGIVYGNITSVTVNTRAKRRWGQCRRIKGHYEINISERLLQDDVSEKALMNTLIHEILHSCKGCMNHGAEWQNKANLVNDCYYGYNIKRCSSAEEKGIKETIETKYKYVVKCENCGQKYYYMRTPKFAKDNFKSCYCPVCKGKNLKMMAL